MKFIANFPGSTLYPGLGKHWWEQITPEEMVEAARRLDELGYDAIQLGEHLGMHVDFARELGPRFMHLTSVAGFIAAATTRIKIIGQLIVPCHHPFELAQAIATADYVSGGRMIPVLMVGYMPWEFELAKAPPFEERGAVMDEYVEAMIELWNTDEPRYDGRYIRFADIVFDPRPVQRLLPVWFGGRTKAALRRLARFGDGWYTYATPRPQLRERIDYIRSQPAFQERPRPLEIVLGLFEGYRDPVTHKVVRQPEIVFEKEPILAQVQELADAGATMTEANDLLGTGKYQNDRPDAPPKTHSFSEWLERVHWFAEEILPDARAIEAAVPVS
jgi:probable F420-dependent oxidoreductase